MQQVLEFILKNVLGEDVDYKVTQSEDEYGLVFTIEVPDDTKGLLIGRSGRNIRAIRNVVGVVARREHKRVFIKIQD